MQTLPSGHTHHTTPTHPSQVTPLREAPDVAAPPRHRPAIEAAVRAVRVVLALVVEWAEATVQWIKARVEGPSHNLTLPHPQVTILTCPSWHAHPDMPVLTCPPTQARVEEDLDVPTALLRRRARLAYLDRRASFHYPQRLWLACLLSLWVVAMFLLLLLNIGDWVASSLEFSATLSEDLNAQVQHSTA